MGFFEKIKNFFKKEKKNNDLVKNTNNDFNKDVKVTDEIKIEETKKVSPKTKKTVTKKTVTKKSTVKKTASKAKNNNTKSTPKNK